MDGTEQVLFESTELGEYSGYIILNEMQTNDDITLKCYIKNEEDGNYYLADSALFEDVQATPTIRIAQVCGKVGIKFTAKQDAGTNRTISHMWLKRG